MDHVLSDDTTKRRIVEAQNKAFMQMLKLRLNMEELAKTFEQTAERKASLAEVLLRRLG